MYPEFMSGCIGKILTCVLLKISKKTSNIIYIFCHFSKQRQNKTKSSFIEYEVRFFSIVCTNNLEPGIVQYKDVVLQV